MGINYYLAKNYCNKCNRYESIHIGKSSYGWTFSFRAYKNIRSFDDWKKEFIGNRIFDEYGKEITINDFVKMVESKKIFNGKEADNHAKLYPQDSFLDKDNNSFSDYEFC